MIGERANAENGLACFAAVDDHTDEVDLVTASPAAARSTATIGYDEVTRDEFRAWRVLVALEALIVDAEDIDRTAIPPGSRLRLAADIRLMAEEIAQRIGGP